MKKLAVFMLAMALAVSTSISAMAAGFTPSVQGKDAPDVVTKIVISEDGSLKKYSGQVVDKNGKVVKNVENKKIVITPVSKVKKAPKAIKTELEKAYKQIKEAKSLKDLVPDIDKHLKSLSKTLKVENMVVRDLFDVTIDQETEKLLKNGNSVQLTFKLDIKATDKVVCLYQDNDGKWKAIDKSRVKNNKDGTVTVNITESGPIAFVVEKKNTVRKTLGSAF